MSSPSRGASLTQQIPPRQRTPSGWTPTGTRTRQRVDEDRIHQIIDNLVGNAIKYTDGGTITVGVGPSHREGWNIEISVADEGRGIPETEREQLFSAFYRRREASEGAMPGLGLGLFICAELAHAHGGKIEIEDAPTGGTRFVVLLEPSTPREATRRKAA